MSLGVFFQEMLVLYIIGIIGFVARKREILNHHATHVLTQLILTLTLPFLILYSMGQPNYKEMTGELFWLIPISVFALCISILLASLLRRMLSMPKDRKSVFAGLIIFGNQGFIGFAIVASLFPEHGPLYVSLFNLPYLILIWTYGVYLFVGNKENVPWRKIFFNPGIIATLTGLIVFLLPVHWPNIISSVFHIVGSTTVPLSMLLIGALIAGMNIGRSISILKDKTIWLAAGARLILIPSLLLPLVYFQLPFPLIATAVLVTATPAAPTIALYSQAYGGDTNYAAIGSAVTTAVSAFSISGLYILLFFLDQLFSP